VKKNPLLHCIEILDQEMKVQDLTDLSQTPHLTKVLVRMGPPYTLVILPLAVLSLLCPYEDGDKVLS